MTKTFQFSSFIEFFSTHTDFGGKTTFLMFWHEKMFTKNRRKTVATASIVMVDASFKVNNPFFLSLKRSLFPLHLTEKFLFQIHLDVEMKIQKSFLDTD